jgi:dienelactone hydrolase
MLHSITSRRNALRAGLLSIGAAFVPNISPPAFASAAQVGGRAEGELYEGKGLGGGGQLDLRLTVSLRGDPDVVEVWQRMRPYSLDSWVSEYARVAEKNERLAEQFEKEGRKVTASDYYLRAAGFYSNACWPQPESDPRMLPTYNKMMEVASRAYKLVPPPFERVEIPYEGATLTAYFSKPRGAAAGQRHPAVYAYGGADSCIYGGGGGTFTARGMAYLAVDGPGQGGTLRLKHIVSPPDSERVAKVVIDYLVARADVDPNRIGIVGTSMAGYNAPRCASGDKRIKACAANSCAFSLREDIFDYFPPIQERIRWLIGAKDMADARKKIADFTLEGRAQLIECPMLIGYSKDDRVMDPQGAFRLYQAAVNSKREMLEGTGHNHPTRVGGPDPLRPPVIEDWMAKQLVG